MNEPDAPGSRNSSVRIFGVADRISNSALASRALSTLKVTAPAGAVSVTGSHPVSVRERATVAAAVGVAVSAGAAAVVPPLEPPSLPHAPAPSAIAASKATADLDMGSLPIVWCWPG